jgi:hypothetical protein
VEIIENCKITIEMVLEFIADSLAIFYEDIKFSKVTSKQKPI